MYKLFVPLGALLFSVHAAVAQNSGYVIQGPGQRPIDAAAAAYDRGVDEIFQGHRAKAVKWYRRAADQGHPMAQSFLGIMYAGGEGVPQDYVRAHMWFNLSAATATGERDFAAKNRDDVAAKMTPAQIAEAQKLASEWKAKRER